MFQQSRTKPIGKRRHVDTAANPTRPSAQTLGYSLLSPTPAEGKEESLSNSYPLLSAPVVQTPREVPATKRSTAWPRGSKMQCNSVPTVDQEPSWHPNKHHCYIHPPAAAVLLQGRWKRPGFGFKSVVEIRGSEQQAEVGRGSKIET